MSLPLRPPYAPMEARVVDEIPAGPGWLRAATSIVFRNTSLKAFSVRTVAT